MKIKLNIRKLLLAGIILNVLLIAGCLRKENSVPLKFKGYEHNPILTPGEPGSWDEIILLGPQAYWYDSLFYLFYSGSNNQGRTAIGLATSLDGIHYSKFEGNPLLFPDDFGYDAWLVAGAVLLNHDTIWHMYFGAAELIRYGPGQSIGHATSVCGITGPWIKDEKPILTIGSMGEWDGGFIFPASFIRMADGSYRIYYTGGGDFVHDVVTLTGMAFSVDGTNWKKYNDPATSQHPFAESDPLLRAGDKKAWNSHGSWFSVVYEINGGYNMYFTGSTFREEWNDCSIGFATSSDGIHWEQHPDNPVFTVDNDPFAAAYGKDAIIEDSWLVFHDTVCFMYYDYGVKIGKIGVAIAPFDR